MNAMKELGVAVTAKDMQPFKMDGTTFDPKNADAYAKSFPIHNIQG
jgi:hypothetical protein